MTSYADSECFDHFFTVMLNLPTPTVLPGALVQNGVTDISTLLLVGDSDFDALTYKPEPSEEEEDVKPQFLSLGEKLRLQQGLTWLKHIGNISAQDFLSSTPSDIHN